MPLRSAFLPGASVILLAAATAPHALADLGSAEAIRECARANAPDTTSTQAIVLRSVDRAGNERELQARLRWKKHDDGHVRLNIGVREPLDLRGSSYLVIENEPQDTVYAYLPAMARSRRIAGGGNRQIWSTDFSYEDIRLLQMKSSSAPAERLDDDTVADRATYVIAQQPDPGRETGYDRVLSFVDKETCVVLRTDYFESGDTPRKRLLADPASVRRINDKWIAHELGMTDLRDDTQSWITISRVTLDEKISSRHFNIGQYWGR